jgi:hypothetical protein
VEKTIRSPRKHNKFCGKNNKIPRKTIGFGRKDNKLQGSI